MTPFNDIRVGQRFGNLTVFRIVKQRRSAGGHVYCADCLCICGWPSRIECAKLRSGARKNCRRCTSKEAQKKIKRLSKEELFLRIKENQYRTGANQRGHEWDFTRESFRGVFLGNCFYCGIYPAKGVDRRNNFIGYTLENSVSCCSQCNYAKRDQPEELFREWINRVSTYQKGYDL